MDRRGFDAVWSDLDFELRHEIRGAVLAIVSKLAPGALVEAPCPWCGPDGHEVECPHQDTTEEAP